MDHTYIALLQCLALKQGQALDRRHHQLCTPTARLLSNSFLIAPTLPPSPVVHPTSHPHPTAPTPIRSLLVPFDAARFLPQPFLAAPNLTMTASSTLRSFLAPLLLSAFALLLVLCPLSVSAQGSASLCLIFYSLPGSPDYPWSSAVKLSVNYQPTSNSSVVLLTGGSGTRTFTNKFGAASTISVTVPSASSTNDNLVILGSSLPFTSSGIAIGLASPTALPGNGPLALLSKLRYFAQTVTLSSPTAPTQRLTYINEDASSRIDYLGSAFVSNLPGFLNVTIGPTNINNGAANTATCAAPIDFRNGVRPPVQPIPGQNIFPTIAYSYVVGDGATYTITTNLTLTADSASAHTDSLGNQYQTIVAVTGTRTYMFPRNGQTLVSSVVGNSSQTAAGAASQRFYPFALLGSNPGVYTVNTAPFVDFAGIGFTLSPPVPTAGLRTDSGTLLDTGKVYTEARLLQPVLVDGLFTPDGGFTVSGPTGTPVISVQQQSYKPFTPTGLIFQLSASSAPIIAASYVASVAANAFDGINSTLPYSAGGVFIGFNNQPPNIPAENGQNLGNDYLGSSWSYLGRAGWSERAYGSTIYVPLSVPTGPTTRVAGILLIAGGILFNGSATNEVWSSVDTFSTTTGARTLGQNWVLNGGGDCSVNCTTIAFSPRALNGLVIATAFNNAATIYAYLLGGASQLDPRQLIAYNDIYYTVGRAITPWVRLSTAPWSPRYAFGTQPYTFQSGVTGVVIVGGQLQTGISTNEVWVWNPTVSGTAGWTKLSAPGGSFPAAGFVNLVRDGAVYYILGGQQSQYLGAPFTYPLTQPFKSVIDAAAGTASWTGTVPQLPNLQRSNQNALFTSDVRAGRSALVYFGGLAFNGAGQPYAALQDVYSASA